MITNCLPFSIWISVALSGVVYLTLFAGLKWGDLDEFLAGVSFYLFIFCTVTAASIFFPVQTQVNSIKVFLHHTTGDTIATTNNCFLCILPKSTGTNGFTYIKQINIINFHEVVLKTKYSY